MISLERFRDAHLPHRKSILEEYISYRGQVSRDGRNCYIDATLITCRSLCGLLGFEVVSRGVKDMSDPHQALVRFKNFSKIRKNLDSRVKINNIKDLAELHAISDWQEIVVSLNAANKCVAHFDEDLDLEHGAKPEIVECAARAVLRELSCRITY